MNIFITSSAKVTPKELAHAYVQEFSIDESLAIEHLRANLHEMSLIEVCRWFDHMVEQLADAESSTDTLVALLGALEKMDNSSSHGHIAGP